MLCENPFEGGGGYTPEQVGDMSLDQILFRLCDRNLLKKKVGQRISKRSLDAVTGSMKARSKDGKPITLKSVGKSKAQMIREQQEKEKREKRRKRRRGK
jgi:hypothetical protein